MPARLSATRQRTHAVISIQRATYFKAGYVAMLVGKDIDDNPYYAMGDVISQRSDRWECGWFRAWREREWGQTRRFPEVWGSECTV